MSNSLKSCRLPVVALAFACLFVLQVLAASFATGASAASPTVDTFGNPLCITHLNAGDEGALPGKKNTPVPDCCTVACSMALLAAPAPFASDILFDPFARPAPHAFGDDFHLLRNPADELPGYPRAPPAFA